MGRGIINNYAGTTGVNWTEGQPNEKDECRQQ